MLTTRPDGRTYLSFKDVAPDDYAQHLADAVTATASPLHAYVDGRDEQLTNVCRNAGFTSWFETTDYAVPFQSALAHLPHRGVPRGFEIVGADAVDATALFHLDEQLRQDVPGVDGWVGNRDWFNDEVNSPEFDPAGYLVATHGQSNRLVGLARIWKRQPRPRFGLLATLPPHRSGFLAAALLHRSLSGASAWGSETFETSTARPALQRRLERMGGTRIATFAHLIRP